MKKLKLKFYRNAVGFTQGDMAKAVVLGKSTYIAKELGYRDFTDKEKIKILDFFKSKGFNDLSIDELFF